MAAKAFVIMFPGGDFEYGVNGGRFPSIGDTLRLRGELWAVTRIVRDGADTVFVQRVEDSGSSK
jgi:hypothetical protein